jgi:hypothetical protein
MLILPQQIMYLTLVFSKIWKNCFNNKNLLEKIKKSQKILLEAYDLWENNGF